MSTVNKIILTWILCRAVEASATLCGTSKHLAVLILALTNHCWKSLKAARNLCSNKRSLFWHSLDARRLRLLDKRNVKERFNTFTGWNPHHRDGQRKKGVTIGGSVSCLLPMCSSKQRGYKYRCSDTVHTVRTLWRRRRRREGSLGEEQEWERGRWRNGKVGEVEGMSVGAKRQSGGWW